VAKKIKDIMASEREPDKRHILKILKSKSQKEDEKELHKQERELRK
jgi:hypothetical protein